MTVTEPKAAEPTRDRPSCHLTWRSIGLTLALLVVLLWAAQHEWAFKSQPLWCIVAALAGLLVANFVERATPWPPLPCRAKDGPRNPKSEISDPKSEI
jgi:hypothetical protein